MKNVPQPKEQARILKAALAELGIKVPHQKALGVVAQLMGHKDWQTHSAAFEDAQAAKASEAKALDTIIGPEDGELYEALVTVDQTLSARIRVRAHDEEEARRLLSQAGHAQYPYGFEVDEGNYRGQGDFYLGDPSDITNLSEPEYEHAIGDFSASVTWHVDHFKYEVDISRNEPDHANDDRRAKATQIVSVSSKGMTCRLQSSVQVYGDLEDYLKEGFEDGAFDDHIAKMRRKVQDHLRRRK